jgi:hypothetical protein
LCVGFGEETDRLHLSLSYFIFLLSATGFSYGKRNSQLPLPRHGRFTLARPSELAVRRAAGAVRTHVSHLPPPGTALTGQAVCPSLLSSAILHDRRSCGEPFLQYTLALTYTRPGLRCMDEQSRYAHACLGIYCQTALYAHTVYICIIRSEPLALARPASHQYHSQGPGSGALAAIRGFTLRLIFPRAESCPPGRCGQRYPTLQGQV